MEKTIVLVTNQSSSGRIIEAGRLVADRAETELSVLEVLDYDYTLDPEAVNYLFELAKKSGAALRMIFANQKVAAIREALQDQEVKHVLTGLPEGRQSILYSLWQLFPNIDFFIVGSSREPLMVNTRLQYSFA